MDLQGQLNFDSGASARGYHEWVALRKIAVDAAARKLNLPVGHPVEVWLQGGIRLRGTMRLHHELLFIEETRLGQLPLQVEGVTFTQSEIESCVRLD